ncbi:MAG: leucine-rich repeat protein, partial [Solobacterium sp.]|nr:leucine-rich repeat protein [Solobacterium sp.]
MILPLLIVRSSVGLNSGSVTSIGKFAFIDTNITGIQLPSKLRRIGALAFDGTGITEVVLPASLAKIDD